MNAERRRKLQQLIQNSAEKFRMILRKIPRISAHKRRLLVFGGAGLIVLVTALIFLPRLSSVKTHSEENKINFSLQETSLSSPFMYQNINQPFKVYLGSRLQESKPQVKFEQDNSSAEFSPANLISPTVQFEKKDNKTVIYKNIYSDVDLVYSLTEKGVKEEIVVQRLSALNSASFREFKFNLNLKNAVPRKSLEGQTSTYFIDPQDGQYRFHIPQPFMVDTAGARSTEVELQLVKQSDLEGSTSYQIILIPSQEWLSHPARQYPVIIDPSVVHDTSSEFSTGTFNRTKDTGSGSSPKLELPYHELPADIHTVGLWHMNNDWNDSSGNGNNGTGQAGVTFSTSAKLGSHAGSFDGTDDYVSINSVNPFNKGGFTVEVWVSFTAVNRGEDNGVLGHGTAATDQGLHVGERSGVAYFGFFNDDAAGKTLLPANTWIHLAFVYDGSQKLIYVNGNLDTSKSSNAYTSSSSNAEIGRYPWQTTTNYYGKIDELRISDIARSPEEIRQDAQRFLYGVYTSDTVDLTSGTSKVTSLDSLQWTESITPPSAPSGWTKVKPVIIDNTQNSNTLTNYQVKVNVDYDSNMQADFDDLKFTNTSGTNLDYWIEEKGDGAWAKVWVEVDSITANALTTIFMWYGNSGASAGSLDSAAPPVLYEDSLVTGSQSSWNTASTSYVDLPGSSKSVILPAGKAVVNWSLSTSSASGGGWYATQVVIGSTAGGEVYYGTNEQVSHKTYSGSWATAVSGGTVTVKLQVKVRGGGNFTVDGSDHVSWSITVVPSNTVTFADSQVTTSQASWNTTSATFVDLPGSSKSVTLPTGTAVIRWNFGYYKSTTVGGDSVRAVIGSSNGTETYVYTNEISSHKTYSGSWATAVSAGTVTVKLQVRVRGGGALVVDGNDFVAWSIIVVPTSNSSADSQVTGSQSSWNTASTSYIDLPGSSKSVALSKGVAVINWSLSSYSGSGGGWYAARVMVSSTAGGEVYFGTNEASSHKTYSGSWKTSVDNGTVTVKLQVKVRSGGNFSVDSNDHVSWTIINHGFNPENGVGADVEFQTRTSADNSTWEAWKPITNETAIAAMDSDATNWTTSSTAMLTKTDESTIKMEGNGSLKSTVGAPQVDANTRGLWHLEETSGIGAYIQDETSLNNDLTHAGSTLTEGFWGKARYFNGTSDFLYCTDANCGGTTKLDYTGSGGWSIGAWINPDNVTFSTNRDFVTKWKQDTNDRSYFITITNGGVPGMCVSPDGINPYCTSASTTISAKTWQLVVGVYTGSAVKIYLDGKLLHSFSYSSGIYNSAAEFRIGSKQYGAAGPIYFEGKLDEPFVTATALSDETIAEAYRAGRDHRLQKTISSTDLSGKSKVPFYFAADKQGTIAETYIGETDYSVYGADSNTKGLWHLEEIVSRNGGLWKTSSAGSWSTVRSACQSAGGDLVTINDSTENSIAWGLCGGDCWIGFNDQTVEGTFVWAGGSSSGYTNWATGQPDDAGGQDCARLWTTPAGTWDDTGCAVSYVGICEAKAIKDDSGNSNHGLPNGTPTKGKLGGARSFNGSSDYIGVLDSDTLDFGASDSFTLEAWINNQGSGSYQNIIRKDNANMGGTRTYYILRIQTTNVLYGYIYDGTNQVPVGGTTLIANDNKWHHVALVRDVSADKVKIYLDGKLENEATDTTTATLANNAQVNIGAYANSAVVPQEFFNGIIDEARVSNTARSADDIRLAYQYGLRTHQITSDFVTTAGSDGPTSTSDTQFTPDSTTGLYKGDTVIVRENYNGTLYIMQGEVTSISSGLVTVASWSGTAPSGGYSTNTDVFKWQREYWDIGDISPADRNATVRLGLRVLDASEGFVMYLDDFRHNTNYLTDPSGSTPTSTANRYIQYRAILSTNDTLVTPQLTSVTINYTINNRPNTPSLNSPADTATKVSLTPALQTTATDTESDYLIYKIELCTNQEMTENCQTFDQTSSQTGWSGQNAEGGTAYTSGIQATYTVQSALSAGTTYFWRSYAIDQGGSNIWSATQSPVYSFTTTYLPTAPTSLLAEGQTNPSGVTDTTPEFSAIYNDPDSGDIANKYRIQVDDDSGFGTPIWDSGASGTSMTNCNVGTRCQDISYGGASTDLQWGTTYYWQIKYWDQAGAEGAWSTESAYFTMVFFAPPTGCHMDDGSQPGEITVKWQDNTSLETGFRVEKNTDGGGFVFLTNKAVDSTSHLDNTTSADHTYQYRIRAESNNGNSEWCGTTPADLSEGNFKFEGVRMEGVKIE